MTLSGEDSFGENENAADQSVIRGREADLNVRLKEMS